MRTHNIPSYYRKIEVILIMPPDLALLSTLIGSNYPCLELIFMVPQVFEPLKIYCTERLSLKVHTLAFRLSTSSEVYKHLKNENTELKYLCFIKEI